MPVTAESFGQSPHAAWSSAFAAAPELRAWLPLQTYPISAGMKGGFAGSVAMAVLACLYGVLKAGSIWYPINLLAAVVYAGIAETRTCSTQCVSC